MLLNLICSYLMCVKLCVAMATHSWSCNVIWFVVSKGYITSVVWKYYHFNAMVPLFTGNGLWLLYMHAKDLLVDYI